MGDLLCVFSDTVPVMELISTHRFGGGTEMLRDGDVDGALRLMKAGFA